MTTPAPLGVQLPEVDSVVPVFVIDLAEAWGGESEQRKPYDVLDDSTKDLTPGLEASTGPVFVVLQGEAERAIPLLAKEVASEGGWLVCDYLQDPVSRKEFASVRESVAEFGVETRGLPLRQHRADIESVVADERYREPSPPATSMPY